MASLHTAISKGIDWILSQQEADGSWCADFGFRHGSSTSWTTGFVGNRLPILNNYRELVKARNFLMGNRKPHPDYRLGWGYNALTVPDFDSTLEAMQFLKEQVADVLNPYMFLHLYEKGGFSTYTPEDASKLNPGIVTDGWTSPHLEIATNVRRLASELGYQDIVELTDELIIKHLVVKGYRAYWYHHPIVAAGLVMQSGIALSKLPLPPLSADPEQLDWEIINNPFIAAMALEVALQWDCQLYDSVIQFLTQQLLNTQRPDGSWRPYLVLSVPYPDAYDPREVQHINADFVKPLVTVATVINVLSKVA
ncbi:hypothetical protein KJ836_04065 [Patescibacteria group bacterium]|nr:hypothetical protein [Patescibacteria group bacterium]